MGPKKLEMLHSWMASMREQGFKHWAAFEQELMECGAGDWRSVSTEVTTLVEEHVLEESVFPTDDVKLDGMYARAYARGQLIVGGESALERIPTFRMLRVKTPSAYEEALSRVRAGSCVKMLKSDSR